MRVDRGVTLAVTGLATGGAATLGFVVLIPAVASDLQINSVAVGVIPSISYLAALLVAVPAGRAADLLPAGRLIFGAHAVIALGLCLVASAQHPIQLLSGVALAGAGYGLVVPPTNVLAAHGSTRRRGLVMSVKQTGVTAGAAVAGFLLPPVASLAGWRTAVLALAATCLLTTTATIRWAAASEKSVAERRTITRAGSSSARRESSTLPVAMRAYAFLMSAAQFGLIGYLAVELSHGRNWTQLEAGFGTAGVFVGASAGRLLFGLLYDRLAGTRERCLVWASGGGFVLLFFIPAYTTSLTALTILLLGLLGICIGGWNGVFQAVVADLAPPGQLGRFTASGAMYIYVGAVFGPLLLGGLLVSVSSRTAWTLLSGLPFLAFLAMRRRSRA